MNRQQRRAATKAGAGRPGAAQVTHSDLNGARAIADALLLGINRYKAGDLPAAEAMFGQVLQKQPDNVDALHCLGIIAHKRGDYRSAVALIERAVAARPGHAEAHYNLGLALHKLKERARAMQCFRTAIKLKRDYADPHNDLGNVLAEEGRLAEAVEEYGRAIALRPSFFNALYNSGLALQKSGRIGDAILQYDRALALAAPPNRIADVRADRAGAFMAQGRLEEALENYKRALVLDPNHAQARSNYLGCLQYSPDHSPEFAFGQAVDLGLRYRRSRGFTAEGLPAADKSKLRIGYVSGDFRMHPVAYFLERVLASHDKSRVEIFCYANQDSADEVTAQLRPYADCWRGIFDLSDEAVARLIAADGIDILVDLSGHTRGNRLGVFAHKPAPVQATWLGYFATTGLPEMDYILADRFVIPPSDQGLYVEQVLRLPQSYLCFTPPSIEIAVAPLPALATRAVTFGCLNNPTKITPDVVRAWSAILTSVPGSRLALQAPALDDRPTRRRLIDLFASNGIGKDRLLLSGRTARSELLRRYNEVDLALDPFPYNGGTTTAEALWMGVPVVTLSGDRFVSRVGESILSTVGLGDQFIARSHEDYVAKAVALASDLPLLAQLRSELRGNLLASPLCDGPGFACALEEAYRRMWATHCAISATKEAA